jgi:hypothetical protein
MRRTSSPRLSAIRKVSTNTSKNDENVVDAKRSCHLHRHEPFQILESEEMSRQIYPLFLPPGPNNPLPLYTYPTPYPTVPMVKPILPVRTATTQFTWKPRSKEQKSQGDSDHDHHLDHGEHHDLEDHHDYGDHHNPTSHGLMTSNTYTLPYCDCKIVRTTTHTYSYNYGDGTSVCKKCKEEQNKMDEAKEGPDSVPKRIVVNRKDIVHQK